MTSPVLFAWDGENMVPMRQFEKLCNKQFAVGETYWLAEHQERSWASHSHQFAWLKEAWLQLPENLADEYPSPEHLRKRALIQAGFYDEQIVDAGTNAAALRVAAAFRSREEFALVIVRGVFVVIRTAKSQSVRAMGNKAFQESKTKLIEIVSELIGTSPEALERNAGKAA